MTTPRNPFVDMNPADACRDRGWKPGDVVEGPDAFGDTARVRITAIGERCVLGIEVTDPRPTKFRSREGGMVVALTRHVLANEDAWNISWHGWTKAATP